jgi:CspA family cold shock protein
MLMLVGTIAWLHPTDGFGFIAPDREGPSIYVHALRYGDDLPAPYQGQRVKYELAASRKMQKAVNVLSLVELG